MTHEIVPATRPNALRESVLGYVTDGRILPKYPFLIGRRGYYGDSMGAINKNDINVYDDAIFLVEEDQIHAFNANCDPSRYTQDVASLKPGRYLYRPGTHGLSHPKPEQYEALVQAAVVTVERYGAADDTGWFGINIHCGGFGTTGSAGCQTIPPAQWGDKHERKPGDFMTEVHRAMARYATTTLPYLLTSRY
jgi:hypothetical protein